MNNLSNFLTAAIFVTVVFYAPPMISFLLQASDKAEFRKKGELYMQLKHECVRDILLFLRKRTFVW